MKKHFTFEIKLKAYGDYSEFRRLKASFLEECRGEMAKLDSFGLMGLQTQKATAAPTLPVPTNQRPIYLKTKVLGKGGQGIVHRAVNAST